MHEQLAEAVFFKFNEVTMAILFYLENVSNSGSKIELNLSLHAPTTIIFDIKLSS